MLHWCVNKMYMFKFTLTNSFWTMKKIFKKTIGQTRTVLMHEVTKHEVHVRYHCYRLTPINYL